jgi:hypothetical protein
VLAPLVDSGDATITLGLSKSTIESGNLQGTASGTGAGSRSNQVILGFTSNARIQLVDDNGPNNFSYLVPSIPGSSLTVAAIQGYNFEGFAVAHADGLAPGANPTLKIPAQVSPLTPTDGATGVSSATKFTFQSPASNPGPFVLQFYSQDHTIYQAIFVVTANKQLVIPPILGGAFSLYPSGRYVWTVATHGAFASVDAMATKDGFLDEFSWDETTANGPLATSGEFTDTAPREFTTAP